MRGPHMAWMQLVVRALVSGGLIVAASEVAKKHELFDALFNSFPLVPIMAITWIHNDNSVVEKVAAYTTGIPYVVIPSLTLFLSFPVLLRRGMEFWPALGLACLFTIGAYYVGLQLASRYSNIT